MTDRLEQVLTRLSRWSAILGGLVLVFITVMSVLSITGRALVAVRDLPPLNMLPFRMGPIEGDFELVEAGTAFAVFCFLPWCQMMSEHVTVDLLKGPLGPRRDAALAALYNLMMTLVAVFIVWRAYYGMLDKMQYNETTFILQFPVWWGYAVCLPLGALFVVVSAYTVYRSFRQAFKPEMGA